MPEPLLCAASSRRASSRGRERGLGRLGVIVAATLVAAAAWVAFLYGNASEQAIRKLYADNPRTQEEGRELLRQGDRDEVVAALLRTIRSPDEAYGVRRQCIALLDELAGRAPLEEVLRTGEPRVREAVLSSVAQKPWFRTDVMHDAAFDVRGAVATWLAREGDRTRVDAIQLARQLEDATLMEGIRPLLVRSGDPRVHEAQERMRIEGALAAAVQFKDCASVDQALALAQADPDAKVRMRGLQAVHNLVFVTKACPDAVSAETMEGLFRTALHDDDPLLRQVAAVELAKRSDLVATFRARLREMLEDDQETEIVRRHVLEALAGARDEAFGAELPQWFHAKSSMLRSAAVRAAATWGSEDNPYVGSLVGIVRSERESRAVWDNARMLLRDALGGEQGVEATLRAQEGLDRKRWQRFLDDLYEKGAGEGVTRDLYAQRWFATWLAKRVDDEEMRNGLLHNVYARFWDRAAAGDVAGARAALANVLERYRPLFLNEQAWLDTR